jgi:hypothetical protein
MCRFIYSVILLLAVVGLRAEDNRVFRAITASYGLADNSAQTLKCTKTGRMTITTIGNINFYDGASFSHINADQEEKYLLPNYRGQYHLYYDSFHHLWLKGSGNVTCVNLNTETFISNMDSLFTSLGMKGQVYDMFVDQQGEIWLCGKDFIQAAHGQKPFPVSTKLNLQDMDVWEGKDLLLFYEDGSLLCYDVASGKQRYRNRAYGEDMVGTYNRSSVLKRHNKGLFQIRNGEKGGILLHYDVEHRTWKTIMTSEYHLNNMAINGNMLYVASEWGYFIYDIPTGNIEHKNTVREIRKTVSAMISSFLIINFVMICPRDG